LQDEGRLLRQSQQGDNDRNGVGQFWRLLLLSLAGLCCDPNAQAS
jgi:hypothetical protein